MVSLCVFGFIKLFFLLWGRASVSKALGIPWCLVLYYTNQNLRNRFGIERHPYTKSRIGQIPCVYVCMYGMCLCNYSSQTTEPICIKIILANRASYADCYRLLSFETFTPTIFKTPKTPPKGRE